MAQVQVISILAAVLGIAAIGLSLQFKSTKSAPPMTESKALEEPQAPAKQPVTSVIEVPFQDKDAVGPRQLVPAQPTERRVRARLPESAETKAAQALYANREFEEAANVLAAASTNEAAAPQMLDIADGYRMVGTLLQSAENDQKSNPVDALKSYKKALAKDKRVGNGAHTRLIRLRIGQVAPRAARSRMAKAEFEQAKNAADDAARYDQADAVAVVYQSLERRAKHLHGKALRLRKKGSEDEAMQLLRDASKISPRNTEVYEQIRADLKAR